MSFDELQLFSDSKPDLVSVSSVQRHYNSIVEIKANSHACYPKLCYMESKFLCRYGNQSLKGMATLMISMFYMKELSEPLSLITASSKSVEKCGSYWHLNICKWTVKEAAIL